MNFVTTNDITGGNSGSPMLNRSGEIIGLVFDTNIHALGGAYWYDSRVNRTVGIDAGMILDALQHVYHADGLVKEIGAP
jgi:V8-like Glu-specific endopeptidase